MTGIVLEGEQAEEERMRLLEEGQEIPVAVRIRDAQGKKTALWLGLGMSASTAWLYCKEVREGEEPIVSMEGVPAQEAKAFFSSKVDCLRLRQGLVNPSALSLELVEVSPCIEHVIDDLRAEFGIDVGLPG